MITRLKIDDINQVARIHWEELSGFLPELGDEFLKKFYKVSLDIPEMFTLVEKRNGQILGFVTGTISAKGLYKKIFFKDFYSFSLLLLRYFITHPKDIVKIIKIVTYPGFSDDSPELLTIAVKKRHQRKGIGRRLFQKAREEFEGYGGYEGGEGDRGDGEDKGDIKERRLFRVSVYARLLANKFYEKMGCRFDSSFDFLGEKMNYYTYEIKKLKAQSAKVNPPAGG